MTRRGSRDQNRSERVAPVGTPAQEDEADILAEVGGERDENGQLIADEESVRAIGAIDAESVRTNRRMKDVVDKKRGGMKGVTFNTDDLLASYEALIKQWPPNTLDITVRRMTGTQVTRTITSRPRSGVELYEAIKLIHGQYEEAEYEVKCLDTNQKQYRGTGRIIMPDTRAVPPQGQPMQTFYPNGAPIPPGYPPQPAPAFYPPTPGYPPPPGYAAPPSPPAQGQQPPPQQQQQPFPQQSAAPPQVPTVQVMPSQFDPGSMMTIMDQLFQMFQRLQASAQPPPQPPPQYPPQYAPPPLATSMPPPPSAQASPAEMFEWIQRAFGMFQSMTQQPQQQQPAQAPVVYREPPVPPPAQQTAPAGPTKPPPRGYIWGWFPEHAAFALVPETTGGGSEQAPGPFRRPAYMPQGDQGARTPYTGPQHQQQQHAQHPPPPSRPKTPREQFQESIGFVREAASAVEEMQSLLPGFGGGGQQEVAEQPDDDDNPIKIIDTGKGRIAINKSDGALRWAETGMMVLPDVLKWLGEQHQTIQKAAERRQQQQQQQQPRQLAPGYVEVTPGYQPPPGFTAVPVDQDQPQQQQQSPLPPPPAHVPPPIQTSAEPPAGRTWGTPTIPEFDQGEN
jgi:hypothetical protein